MMKRRRRIRKIPTWQDWLKSPRLCEESLTYFERQAQVKRLDERQAKENVVGHMRKSFHNLSLANQIFDNNQKGELRLSYAGESFYDWVVTIGYYAMYQACLAALAAMRKTSENHTATVCALVYYYVHKRKRLNEQYLLSLDAIKNLADQDVQKLIDKRLQREKTSYDTGVSTELGMAQTTLTDSREFVLRIREILEEGLGKDFLKEV